MPIHGSFAFTSLPKIRKPKNISAAAICVVFLITVTVAQAHAQGFLTLVNFNGANGSNPDPKALVKGPDGNLYGTTQNGGANSAGTIFRITPAGALTTLYEFCSQPGCADGSGPVAGLTLGSDGNFYGVASGGGASGVGAVYRITPQGSFTTLASFNASTGDFPFSSLTQARDGNFYGATSNGGNLAACSGFGCGSIFRVTPDGVLTNVHNFCSQANCTDGAVAFDGLMLASNGNLYGGTWQGGVNNGGTIYKFTTAGVFTTLYNFCTLAACADGKNPLWLTQGRDGQFYGTTFSGGAHGAGSVFRITHLGVLTTIYSFCSQANCVDGAQPRAGLTLGVTTNGLYGVTSMGGDKNLGTVFKITLTGKLTSLYSFRGPHGAHPIGGLYASQLGHLYGSTVDGGSNSKGTLFRIQSLP